MEERNKQSTIGVDGVEHPPAFQMYNLPLGELMNLIAFRPCPSGRLCRHCTRAGVADCAAREFIRDLLQTSMRGAVRLMHAL